MMSLEDMNYVLNKQSECNDNIFRAFKAMEVANDDLRRQLLVTQRWVLVIVAVATLLLLNLTR